MENFVCHFTWSQKTNQANQILFSYLGYELAINLKELRMEMICSDVQCNRNVCSKTSTNNCLLPQWKEPGKQMCSSDLLECSSKRLYLRFSARFVIDIYI